MDYLQFSWTDYLLFGLLFGLSAVVGIYFGFYKKQNTTKDYINGGKTMKVLPIAASLIASVLTPAALMGIPAEVYMYGTQYWLFVVSVIIAGVICNATFLPVLYNLQLVSTFEYLEFRFDRKIRTISSGMNTVVSLLAIPILIYAPSLAINQVTGFHVYIIALVTSSFCIFYTTIGGVKAIVWTDTLQFSITICTLCFVIVMGTISVGGPIVVWEKANFGERVEFFNMNPDPTIRSTFWSVAVGNIAAWLYYTGIMQSTVQRFIALPTYGDARKTLILLVVFAILTKSVCCFTGLILYSKYFNCDPLTAGYIKKLDQILPYYVQDVSSQLPGISGLFVAGLFTTALSTLSTAFNALAGTVYQDFVSYFMPTNTSEQKASNVMKSLTILIGIVCTSMIFMVEKLGSIFQMVLSFSSICGGPILGVFLLGICFPVANTKGALYGMCVAIALMSIIIGGNSYYMLTGKIPSESKPMYIDGCQASLEGNSTISVMDLQKASNDSNIEKPFWLFSFSFYYYFLIGSITTVLVGLIVSFITKNNKSSPVKLDLLCPLARGFVRKSLTKEMIDLDGKM